MYDPHRGNTGSVLCQHTLNVGQKEIAEGKSSLRKHSLSLLSWIKKLLTLAVGKFLYGSFPVITPVMDVGPRHFTPSPTCPSCPYNTFLSFPPPPNYQHTWEKKGKDEEGLSGQGGGGDAAAVTGAQFCPNVKAP